MSAPAYHPLTKLFHWVTALTVIALIGVGLYMGDLPGGLEKLKLYNLHKSVGVAVLALTALRVLWHLASPPPGPLASLPAWQRMAARGAHLALYAALIGMPLSGWLMSSAAGRPVAPFGLFTLPDLVLQDQELAEFFHETHGIMGTVLMILVGLHVAAALKHHLLDRDATLRRMLPFGGK